MNNNQVILIISVIILSIIFLVSFSPVAGDIAGDMMGNDTGTDNGDQSISPDSAIPGTTLRIGVLANRGPDIALKEWGPTAGYLSREISPNRFEIVPLTFNETMNLSYGDGLAFLIANPSVYTFLEYKSRALCIATLQVPGDPDPQPVFGGVIFTRSDRNDIQGISDLRGKRFSAVDQSSLGGWQAALKEIEEEGIHPDLDFSALNFTGTHDASVRAVLDGDADAGTVRSTQLERMASEGIVDLNQIRILNSQGSMYPHYPYLLSTSLYPEWTFAAVTGTDQDLSKNVSVALLIMSPDDPAALAAHGAGWAVPQDHTPVHELLRELNLPPYEGSDKPEE